MSDVTVIGLGEMGSALARAFLRSGLRTTVWNRSAAKAADLVAAGAGLAPDAASAAAASPVTVVCVSDYAAAAAILDDAVLAALAGRTLVQLSTGTPREARTLAAGMEARGVRYLDGAILAWPRQIGGEEAVIVASGPQAVFEDAEPLLRRLAGGVIHQGVDPGAAAALFAAVLAYLAGHWIGFAHGALVARSEGLDLAGFGETLAGLAPSLGADSRHMAAVIAGGRFAEPESALATAGADIARLVQQAQDAGIGDAWPRFAADLFRRAAAAGYGAEEHVAIVKVMG
ncbi:NAD(P)-binding domain-containing protein [Caulobacter mirabilis]|uniref:3-hydroxyisobutyrate dehydrogenase n=1 Tax=Caulobacter mirabilis TaxID=69666 RepID=A0A2D2AWQ7_9CAUL|nr:NAD(P)-binding domain-containing protein [Caulobacter mirabilis]ATQ42439.1 3-hydroxyisobutyrate dehydrogenase [Caulobacter mirabilis]